MHQSHNIPWDLIASNFVFKEDDNRYTPTFTGLVSRQRSSASNEVKHFVRKFAQTIRSFSETERAKYPPRYPQRSEGALFSDALRDKHPDYLNARNQQIEYWIQRAQGNPKEGSTAVDITYDTRHGELADVVKVLLYENEMEALFMLAQHPKIPVAKLQNLSWGHHFGFSRVKESALRSYIFFNTAEVSGILDTGKYTLTQGYRGLLSEIGIGMDYPAQQIPHRVFLQDCGVLDSQGFIVWKGRPWTDGTWARDVFVHKDYELLQGYLKTLFALMYRYDTLIKECGLETCWEVEIAQYYPLNAVVSIDHKWVEEENRWNSLLV